MNQKANESGELSKNASVTDHEPEMGTKSALLWSAASGYGAFGMKLIISIVVARLLLPETFGLFAIAYLFVGLVNQLRNVGFGASILQKKELSKPLLNAIYWCNAAVCLAIGGCICLIAPLSAHWFDEAELLPLTLALSLTVIAPAINTVPSALLQKRFAFDRLAIRELGNVFFEGGTTIVTALMGFEVWALVFGQLAGCVFRIISINLANPFFPGFRLDVVGLRECLKFGLNVTAVRILNYLSKNADVVVIGAFLGTYPLGIFTIAAKYLKLPKQLIDKLANRVMLTVFCRDQDDQEKLGEVFLRARSCSCLIVFPVMAGLSILADPFVRTVLGEKWEEAIPLLRWLSLSCAIESLAAMNRSLFIATGRARTLLYITCFGSVLRVLLVLGAVQFGIEAVAIAHVIGSLLITPVSLNVLLKAVRTLSMSQLSRNILLCSIPTAIMSVSLLCFVLLGREFQLHSAMQLVMGTILGGLIYVIAITLLQPPCFDDLVSVLPKKTRKWVLRTSPSGSVS